MIDALSDDYLGSPEVASCFGAEASCAHMLAFEAALAEVQAELALIPQAAAETIVACAGTLQPDLAQLREATVAASNPATPLVAMLTAAVAASDKGAARYVHWGATSQDVMDSALMLAARTAIEHLDARLRRIEHALATLSDTHRATPMVARTLGQQSGPTTFGLKVAGWLNGLVAAHERLGALYARVPLQCGGASGTLAAFGDDAVAVAELLAARLGLAPRAPWHTERGIVRELAAAFADVCAAAGKPATDIVLAAQNEIGELAEAAAPARGGSPAMAHERNPVAAIAVVACARRAPGALATVYGSFDHWHERAAGAWHAEAPALAELATLAGGALAQLERALGGLEVDTAAMRRHLEADLGLGMSEAVSMALAPALGRAAAQALVRQAESSAREQQRPLGDVLGAMDRVGEHLDAAALARALDPLAFLGANAHFIDQALARAAVLTGASPLQASPAAVEQSTSATSAAPAVADANREEQDDG